jgi:ABC-type transport system involved in multi-copper enzyme maturation permease subunit
MTPPIGYKGLVAFHIIYPLGMSVLYVRAGKVMLLYGYRVFLLPQPFSRVFIIPYQCLLLGIYRYDLIAFFYVPLCLGIAIVKRGMTVRVLPAIGDTFPVRLQGVSQGRYLL